MCDSEIEKELEAYILHSCAARPQPQHELVIDFSSDYNRLTLPAEYERRIDDVWADRCAANKSIWNGSKFRFDGFEAEERTGRVKWKLGLTCYKDFLGTNFSPDAEMLQKLGQEGHNNPQAYMADPLGVGALLVTSDNQVIILKRSENVAEAPGLYDVPGGHPEPEEIGGKVDISDMDLSLFTPDLIVDEIYSSILREVRDEVNIPLQSLSAPLLLGVAVNKASHGRPSSEYLIRTTLSSEEITELYNSGNQAEADETTNIKFIPHHQFVDNNIELLRSQAPSAQGCFLLYLDYLRHSSADAEAGGC